MHRVFVDINALVYDYCLFVTTKYVIYLPSLTFSQFHPVLVPMLSCLCTLLFIFSQFSSFLTLFPISVSSNGFLALLTPPCLQLLHSWCKLSNSSWGERPKEPGWCNLLHTADPQTANLVLCKASCTIIHSVMTTAIDPLLFACPLS